MTDIVTKCVEWNKARYNQEFDYDLALKLITEELDETLEASDNPVEFIDGIGDTIFVAIGILWKIGLDVDIIKAIFNINIETGEIQEPNFAISNINKLNNNIGYMIADLLTEVETTDEATAVVFSMMAINTCCVLLKERGLQQEFYNIVDAICNSNNTKSLPSEKVNSSVKANIDKGKNFVAPTLALKAILSKYTH